MATVDINPEFEIKLTPMVNAVQNSANATTKKHLRGLVEHANVANSEWMELEDLLALVLKTVQAHYVVFQIVHWIARIFDRKIQSEMWSAAPSSSNLEPYNQVTKVRAMQVQQWSRYDRNRAVLRYFAASQKHFSASHQQFFTLMVDAASAVHGKSSLFGALVDAAGHAMWTCPKDPTPMSVPMPVSESISCAAECTVSVANFGVGQVWCT